MRGSHGAVVFWSKLSPEDGRSTFLRNSVPTRRHIPADLHGQTAENAEYLYCPIKEATFLTSAHVNLSTKQ